jgi:hypothetical protein
MKRNCHREAEEVGWNRGETDHSSGIPSVDREPLFASFIHSHPHHCIPQLRLEIPSSHGPAANPA